jgi:hypothetical protein
MAVKTKAVPDIVKLRGIVINRALASFNLLPEAAKRYIDLEDWISAGILFVTGVLSARMSKSFNPTAGTSMSTFVYKALDNFYHNELGAQQTSKRKTSMVSWDDLLSSAEPKSQRSLEFVDRIDAIRKVQEMHRAASIDLVLYLDQHFFTGDYSQRFVTRGKLFQAHKVEFQRLAKRAMVTIDDYRLAIQIYHELTVSRLPL